MSTIKALQRTRVFKFFSSVKLAVPLMAILLVLSAAGTVFESNYNSQYATLIVYRAWYFELLLVLLWSNIFCATLSRIPFKKHHTGFVITHIGLLLLLAGSLVTATLGVDGELRIEEGKSENTVYLQSLELRATRPDLMTTRSFAIDRPLEKLDLAALSQINQELSSASLQIDQIEPFVEVKDGYTQDPSLQAGPAVEFELKSNFFNLVEWLHTDSRPELSMGPATFQIAWDKSTQKVKPKSGVSVPRKGQEILIVRKASDQTEMARVEINQLRSRPLRVGSFSIKLLKRYRNAAVVNGKIADNPTRSSDHSAPNLALELQLEHRGQKLREVVFQKFPQFSLLKDPEFGLKFELLSDSGSPEQNPQTETSSQSGGNLIRFLLTKNQEQKPSITLALSKNGKEILRKPIFENQPIQTPWMGIQVTIKKVISSANPGDTVMPTSLAKRAPFAPSAAMISFPAEGQRKKTWLIEGSSQDFNLSQQSIQLYYGPKTIKLPFEVSLLQFKKKDYPGTSTPMSFESDVSLSDLPGKKLTISMNEPLKSHGFTLYQASFISEPGRPNISVFSVNQDPGRIIKYLGSLILITGIAVYTIMRSRWYQVRKRLASLAITGLVPALFFLNQTATCAQAAQTNSPFVDSFIAQAKSIDTSEIDSLPVQNNGRVKPFQTLARESVLFIAGKYSMLGLNASQLYLGLIVFGPQNQRDSLPIIELRDPDLRVQLGFAKDSRFVSAKELSDSPLLTLASPLIEMQQTNSKGLSERDRLLLDTLQQLWLYKEISSADHFLSAVDFSKLLEQPAQEHSPAVASAVNYLKALESLSLPDSISAARELVKISNTQASPDLFEAQIEKVRIEVFYNHYRPFLIAAFLYLIAGITLMAWPDRSKNKLGKKLSFLFIGLPLILHVIGFVLRVYITGFAPITNMYGTMLWVSLGVALFSVILLALYQNKYQVGLLLLGSATVLIIAESVPLVLSPNMDPIVAVLRNNFWLSTHVTTITISYAALTIACLFGNASLVVSLLSWPNSRKFEFYRTWGHSSYRMIQLGVFLLTGGIILGGIWADYSWGRFWGWDPKETWALIADLGFLILLHARYLGWIGEFGLLLGSVLAYLLVVMAWYGVNFILAAGLHSYGFSSGGARFVMIFLVAQFLLIAAALAKNPALLKKIKKRTA